VSLDPADTATVALAARAQLGECPLWSPTEARLYWEDIDGRAVHRFDPASGVDEVREAPGRPGSLALTSTAGVVDRHYTVPTLKPTMPAGVTRRTADP